MVIRNASLDAMIDMINEVRRQLERLMDHGVLSGTAEGSSEEPVIGTTINL
jgi:hypothetical protein